MSHPSLVLLNRLLAGKEAPPLSLVVDSLAQSAARLVAEFVHHTNVPITYLAFETTLPPPYAAHFLHCPRKAPSEIVAFCKAAAGSSPGGRMLVVVDSLNYIAAEDLAAFVAALVAPSCSVLACFHRNVPCPKRSGYPSPLALLSYIAQAIYEVDPLYGDAREETETAVGRFRFPVRSGLNSPVFRLHLTHRRKSGKSLVNEYIVDSNTHTYDVFKPQAEAQDDDELLKDLTTFNLTTSSKQKLAREQVELPFMEAQAELGKFGGAIVYEFEKDDDYDEEDPYEDPF